MKFGSREPGLKSIGTILCVCVRVGIRVNRSRLRDVWFNGGEGERGGGDGGVGSDNNGGGGGGGAC